MPEISDADIISLFHDPAQKEKSFSLLVEKYRERLYFHCRSILIRHDDADDALQNTFIKAWNGLANFRSDSGLFTWLYRIATNEALTLLKQKKRQTNHQSDSYEDYLADTLETDTYFDGDEIERELQKAILTLPDKQRLVFRMKYYNDMKYEEISKILGTSEGALKASYHHAVKKIENFFNDD